MSEERALRPVRRRATRRREAFALIDAERDRQTEMWGAQWLPGSIAPAMKLAILTEEVGEVARALLEAGEAETPHLRQELVEVAAVCVAWIESVKMEGEER